jgi:hypothetical protein
MRAVDDVADLEEYGASPSFVSRGFVFPNPRTLHFAPPPKLRRVSSNERQLFHQTDRCAAARIVAAQKMVRGFSGLGGGGIYFAKTPSATNLKAHHHGVVLVATVWLGRVKQVGPEGAPGMTFSRLRGEGYDSLCILRGGGVEYVVYNYDQVEKIKAVSRTC